MRNTHTNRLIQTLKKIDIIYNEPTKLAHTEISDFYVDIKKAYGYTIPNKNDKIVIIDDVFTTEEVYKK